MKRTASIQIDVDIFLGMCMKKDFTRYYDVTKDAIPADAIAIGARVREYKHWRVVEVYFESEQIEVDDKVFTPVFTEVR